MTWRRGGKRVQAVQFNRYLPAAVRSLVAWPGMIPNLDGGRPWQGSSQVLFARATFWKSAEKLCAVLKADNIHPGKGTPVTHLEMRRIADGVKITERYRTTEQVERAFMEERDLQYIYEDDIGFVFMDKETYDQFTVPADVVGDSSVYLQPEMMCIVMLHEGIPVSMSLPQRVVVEIVEADPVCKRPDRVVILQAGNGRQWSQGHGAAAYLGRDACRRDDRGWVLRRACQRLGGARIDLGVMLTFHQGQLTGANSTGASSTGSA